MTLHELLERINTPGWDWPVDDLSWVASKSGLRRKEPDGGETSVFFIHGGRIREQAHIPYGFHDMEVFITLVRKCARGLDNPTVCWVADCGSGEPALWIEGTRIPREDDLLRLEAARKRQREEDDRTMKEIEKRRLRNYA